MLQDLLTKAKQDPSEANIQALDVELNQICKLEIKINPKMKTKVDRTHIRHNQIKIYKGIQIIGDVIYLCYQSGIFGECMMWVDIMAISGLSGEQKKR